MARKRKTKAEPEIQANDEINEAAAEAEAEAASSAASTAAGEAVTPLVDEPLPELGGPEVIEQLLSDTPDDLDLPEVDEVVPSTGPAKDAEPAAVEAEAEVEPKPVSEKPEGEKLPATEVKPEAEPVAAAPVVPPKEESAQPSPQATPAEAPEPITPEQLTERYNDWRNDTEQMLADNQYKLTDEMADQLSTDAGVAIPRLMAKVYVDATTAAVGHLVANFPQLLESALKGREKTSEDEQTFYDAWPQLNAAEHGAILNQYGVAYRQLHPQASAEDFIRDVGAQVMVAHKIPVDGGTPVEPIAAASPAPAPFTPARSAAPGGGGPSTPANVFEAISDQFDFEELDLDVD